MGEFGTKICKSSAHFGAYFGELGAYLGELHGDFGSEVGEPQFHLGLGENGGRGDVVFGREAIPVDGRDGVHQFGRIFVAKNADEFVRDTKPGCFIKSLCAVFLQSFQGTVKIQSNDWPQQLWRSHTNTWRHKKTGGKNGRETAHSCHHKN